MGGAMSTDLNLLLVDDNPAILELLRKGLLGVARLHLAASGRRAVEMARALPADLVVCDLDMPEMDGAQVLRQLRSQPQTAKIPVILMSRRGSSGERLQEAREACEDIIEKPFFLREATRRIKRTVDNIALEKLSRAAQHGVVRGALDQMNVIDLMQSLELGRKSCQLSLQSGERAADLRFTGGELMYAACDGLLGDEAVYRAVSFTSGSWSLNFSLAADVRNTTRSTQALLMEGLRRMDEANRDADEL